MTTDEDTKKLLDALKKAGEKTGFTVMEGEEAHKFMETELNKPENVKARKENAKKNKSRLDEFFAKEHKYKWVKGMGEISGFGGSYEQGCRAMVIAGLEYWDAHPDLDPRFKGWEGVYGLLDKDNLDAAKLDSEVLYAVDSECTGAMHQAAIQTILYIKKHGWDAYVEDMSKPTRKEKKK